MKRETRRGLYIFGAYVTIIAAGATHLTISEISRTDIENLDLVDKTVNQAKEILKSEGYSKKDYSFITEDGKRPASTWKVTRVEDARSGRIFIESKIKQPLDSLNLIGLRWSVAHEKLREEGYEKDKDYQIDSNQENIWLSSQWIVKDVKLKELTVPKVILEKVENKDSTDDSIDWEGFIGKTLKEVEKSIEGVDNWSYRSDDSNLVISHSSWVVKDVVDERGKKILIVSRIEK